MRVLFTICGRAGSKGVINKNVRNILGYPIPYYSLSVIDLFAKYNKSTKFDIVLNTDSRELKDVVLKQHKLIVSVVDRPKKLSEDNSPKLAVISDSFEKMVKQHGKTYDMVVDLDLTSPLRTINDLENIISKKAFCYDYDVVFSVTDSRRNPYFNMVKRGKNGYERVISTSLNARQEAPIVFDMNASLYAFDPVFLGSGKSLFEGKCETIKMMDTGVLDIDSEEDLELIEIISSYLFRNKKYNYREIYQNIPSLISS